MWLFVLEPGILKWQLNYLKNDFLMSVCQMFRGKNFIILYSPLPLYSPNQHYCCLYFFGKISYLCHLIGTSISTLDSYSLLDKPKYSKGVKFALQKGMQHLISQVLPDLSSDMDGLLIFWLNILTFTTGHGCWLDPFRASVGQGAEYWPPRANRDLICPLRWLCSEPDLLISPVSHWTLPSDHKL